MGYIRAAAVAAATLLIGSMPGTAQAPDVPPLFAAREPVEVTLVADFSLLDDDRREDAPERPTTVVVTGGGGEEIELDGQLRTRGRFRLERSNCVMPPLRLNVRKGQVAGTILAEQDKLKIVGNCRPGRRSYAVLVLREYLAYRALQAVTDQSFRVRLARITYVDTSGGFDPRTEMAFFIEDDDALAARIGGQVFELAEDQNLPARIFDPVATTRLAVFQYMIGNTDYAEVQGHNVEIFETPAGAVAVPYDFDFSGLVDAPYATPDPEVGIRSVRERRYMGWCRPPGVAEAVLEEFRTARDETRALVAGFEHLDEGEREAVLDYLHPFYDDIESDARATATFLRLCRRLPGAGPPDSDFTRFVPVPYRAGGSGPAWR